MNTGFHPIDFDHLDRKELASKKHLGLPQGVAFFLNRLT